MEKNFYAIFKNGEHKGNIRSKTDKNAIINYIINSGLKSCIDDLEFISKYKAIIAEEELYFRKNNL